MTAAFLIRLSDESVAAASRESEFRKSAAAEIARLEAERAYAYRRMNLLKAMAKIAETVNEPEAAVDAQLLHVFRDLGWIGGGGLSDLAEARKPVAERLRPIAAAIVEEINGAAPEEPADTLFHAFEGWYRTEFGKPFLDAYETYVDDFMYPDA